MTLLVQQRQQLRQLLGDARQQIWRTLPDSVPGSGLGYEPSEAQLDFLDDDHLTTLVAGGERAGKSDTSAMKAFQMTLGFLGDYAASGKAAGEVAWIAADSYELTRPEFDYIVERLKRTPFRVRASKRIDPGQIDINVPGGVFTIKTRSANDAQTLRAESPVWVLVCEASLLTHDAYMRIRSRVGEIRAKYPGYGSIVLSGTFEGSLGWYPTYWSKWQSTAVQESENVKSFSIPSWSNRFIYPLGENDPEIMRMKEDLPESVFRERIQAVPAPPSGRVHQSFDSTIHVQDTSYDPDKPVLLGIDPGYSGRSSTYAVEVVQRRDTGCQNNHYWVVDEIFEKQLTVEQVVNIALARYWWRNAEKVGVIDIAGIAHVGAQESNEEVWMKKTGLILNHEKVNIRPGIDRFESMLQTCPLCSEPYLVFDPKCRGVVSELGGTTNPFDGQVHVYSWQTDREGNVAGHVPRDEYCDGIKALTYLFINQLGFTLTPGARRRAGVKRQRRR